MAILKKKILDEVLYLSASTQPECTLKNQTKLFCKSQSPPGFSVPVLSQYQF